MPKSKRVRRRTRGDSNSIQEVGKEVRGAAGSTGGDIGDRGMEKTMQEEEEKVLDKVQGREAKQQEKVTASKRWQERGREAAGSGKGYGRDRGRVERMQKEKNKD